ncbi:hypothetical protein CHGG_03740 [Chaetomium globosum CBS 148.51]|uniref:Uncharacterized protein n=1 Tax=Chaetomium globosum (strain ATCC 6205 / CBS 148.51 / DSM 1962 / NBRC 6347 / NRRL 1970) TaxID=306901 RepID=Q2H3A6_CHAGB|nr:uncharacterized protein CHGG_03740 [Chaetomium globosum CBS 148.51]EAQ87121.1 hypothetical protein CHGG_03740 [Chaetomium globosum CBS 148.51]
MASLGNWSFNPLPAFAPTVFPNIAMWDVNNTAKNLSYQVQISWPFEWESREVTDKSALTLYILDGNALGTTAAEAIKRRKLIYADQPDAVVVSVGYPLTNAVYDVARRNADFTPPLPPAAPSTGGPEPAGNGRADEFLAFLSGVLRPWVRGTVFPGVGFKRDALYGHSLGGLFVVYALVSEPAAFDTFVAASPGVGWNDGALLEEITQRFGDGLGGGEQFSARRRAETEENFQARKALYRWDHMTEWSHALYDRVRSGNGVSEVVLREYDGQDYSGWAGTVLTEAIEYFFEWDDTNLLVFGRNPEANVRQLEAAWETCIRWADSRGMKFAPEKSELIHFNKGRRQWTEQVNLTNPGGGTSPVKPEGSARFPEESWLDWKTSTGRPTLVASGKEAEEPRAMPCRGSWPKTWGNGASPKREKCTQSAIRSALA